jgi:hypothetical protein
VHTFESLDSVVVPSSNVVIHVSEVVAVAVRPVTLMGPPAQLGELNARRALAGQSLIGLDQLTVEYSVRHSD